MKVARLAVLGVALAAGGGAFYLMSGAKVAPVQMIAAPTIKTDEVLVAAKDLQMGTLITETDMIWQAWPSEATSPGMIVKSTTPGAVEDVKGSVSRANFVQGEPMRKEKLVKGPNSGFLSAVLDSGMRAVAITIESSGSNSAGGFILPNDHVDVIRTYRAMLESRKTGLDLVDSQTLITNVRVLAIGQNIQEKNGERVVIGTNATLELDPGQAEKIIVAQRTGVLSLVLRSMVDSTQPRKMGPVLSGAEDDAGDGPGYTIVRFGIPSVTGPK